MTSLRLLQGIQIEVTGARGPQGITGTITSASGQAVSTKTILAAIPSPQPGQLAFLTSDFEGQFVWTAGDFSARISSDPLQGLYIAPATDTSGHSGAWVRRWDGIHGHPEWFGAQPNNGNFDCADALEACHALCPVMLLGSVDYWITRTVKFQTQYRSVIAPGLSDSYDNGHGCRVICTSQTADAIQVGPDDAPSGGVNAFYRNIVVEGITTLHVNGIIGPAVGSEASGPAGFRFKYLLNGQMRNLNATNSFLGFYAHGLVSTQVQFCNAFRSGSAVSGQDTYFAYFLDEGNPVLAGGNASLYLYRCGASTGVKPTGATYGVHGQGAFVDTFLDFFETANIDHGIKFTGLGPSDQTAGNLDLHIRSCVIDQCAVTALEIAWTNALAAVEITDFYAGLQATTQQGIYIHDGAGAINITGGQVIAGADANPTPGSGPQCIGLQAQNQAGLTVKGLKVLQCGRPIRLGGLSRFDVDVTVLNPGSYADPTEPAVDLFDSKRGKLSVSMDGLAQSFPQIISVLNANNDHVVIDTVNINPAISMTGAGTGVLFINAQKITAPGLYTNAGAASASGTIQVLGFADDLATS